MIEAERIFEAREALADKRWRATWPTNWPAPSRPRAGRRSPFPAARRRSCSSRSCREIDIAVEPRRRDAGRRALGAGDLASAPTPRLVRAHLLQNKAAARALRAAGRTTRERRERCPAFDVAVLGMGNDGHTASFFPGGDTLAEAIDAETAKRLIAITAPGAGEPRLTFTLPACSNRRAACAPHRGRGEAEGAEAGAGRRAGRRHAGARRAARCSRP